MTVWNLAFAAFVFVLTVVAISKQRVPARSSTARRRSHSEEVDRKIRKMLRDRRRAR